MKIDAQLVVYCLTLLIWYIVIIFDIFDFVVWYLTLKFDFMSIGSCLEFV